MSEKHVEVNSESETNTLDCWLNVYRDGSIAGVAHSTSKEANDASDKNRRIACVHIRQKYKVGDGL